MSTSSPSTSSAESAPATIITQEGDVLSITYDPITLDEWNEKLASRWAGAAVFFLGKTRDDRTVNAKNGRQVGVQQLQYEAYTSLALKTIGHIVRRARATPADQWPPAATVHSGSSGCSVAITDDSDSPPAHDAIIRVVLINRLGPVDVGESSILVGVSSPHRRRAFEVAEWLLEETKRIVPIWKKEVRVHVDELGPRSDAPSRWVRLETDQGTLTSSTTA